MSLKLKSIISSHWEKLTLINSNRETVSVKPLRYGRPEAYLIKDIKKGLLLSRREVFIFPTEKGKSATYIPHISLTHQEKTVSCHACACRERGAWEIARVVKNSPCKLEDLSSSLRAHMRKAGKHLCFQPWKQVDPWGPLTGWSSVVVKQARQRACFFLCVFMCVHIYVFVCELSLYFKNTDLGPNYH